MTNEEKQQMLQIALTSLNNLQKISGSANTELLDIKDAIQSIINSESDDVAFIKIGDISPEVDQLKEAINIIKGEKVLTPGLRYGEKTDSLINEVVKDLDLKNDGILTEEEFDCILARADEISMQLDKDYHRGEAVKHISFLFKKPRSVKKISEAKMTEEEGAKFYNSLVDLCNDESEFRKAIERGRVVEPACAVTNASVQYTAAKNAGLEWVASLWENSNNFWPTHNNEYLMYSLGFNYYAFENYIAPKGSIGVWNRYTFHGVNDHSGHIFVIFDDADGSSKNIKVGDNGGYNKYYRPGSGGRCVGFWAPDGVIVNKR